MSAPRYGSATFQLRHHLTARHATTGAPVRRLTAGFLDPAPPGWVLQVKGGDVVVSARVGAPPPASGRPGAPDGPPVRVRILVTDPLQALLLQQPAADVALSAAEIVHSFSPLPQTVTAVVVDEDGEPLTGRAVGADPGGGAAVIDLPEVTGSPGTYRSAPRAWTVADTPFDLVVDGSPQRRVALDADRTDTRIHVVSTT